MQPPKNFPEDVWAYLTDEIQNFVSQSEERWDIVKPDKSKTRITELMKAMEGEISSAEEKAALLNYVLNYCGGPGDPTLIKKFREH